MKIRLTFGLMALCLVLGISSPALGGPVLKSEGELTARDVDGTVLIDGKGFLVSPRVSVQDSQGKPFSLATLSLPAKISFEYRYTPKGPVITLIRVGAVVPK